MGTCSLLGSFLRKSLPSTTINALTRPILCASLETQQMKKKEDKEKKKLCQCRKQDSSSIEKFCRLARCLLESVIS